MNHYLHGVLDARLQSLVSSWLIRLDIKLRALGALTRPAPTFDNLAMAHVPSNFCSLSSWLEA